MHFETQILYIIWTWVYGNKQINKGKTPSEGTRQKKRKGLKSKQKTTLENAKHTMGALKKEIMKSKM
jgi:hypothetical protein